MSPKRIDLKIEALSTSRSFLGTAIAMMGFYVAMIMLVSNDTESLLICFPFGIILVLALGYFLFKCLNSIEYNKRLVICSAIFSAALAIALVLGWNIGQNGIAYLQSYKTWISIVGLIPMFTIVTSKAILLLETKGKSTRKNVYSIFERVKHPFLVIWLFIFICWLPWLLLLWPGGWGFDAGYQTHWIVTGGDDFCLASCFAYSLVISSNVDIAQYMGYLCLWFCVLYAFADVSDLCYIFSYLTYNKAVGYPALGFCIFDSVYMRISWIWNVGIIPH